jgi:N-acetylglucosamine kinase-like BadF-type ATPase
VRPARWEYLIDDERTAYDIGRKALRTAFRSQDGHAPSTKLAPLLKRRFRLGRLDDVLNLIYANGFTVEEFARLAPPVSNAASYDRACMRISKNAGDS